MLVGLSWLVEQFSGSSIGLFELLWKFWPLALIIAGLAAAFYTPKAWPGWLIPLLLGIVFLGRSFGLLQFSLWSALVPMAIILVGAGLVLNQNPQSSTINSGVIWWGSSITNRCQTFKNGSLVAVMGGIEVDLTEAAVLEPAQVAIFTFWGGVNLKVPANWNVEVRGLPLLGGWHNETSQRISDNPAELKIFVTAVMGGVHIQHPDLKSPS